MADLPGFIRIPTTGVIFVLDRAEKQGYLPSDSSWSNLGQGAPEAGAIPNAPPRINQVNICDGNNAYSPIAGQTCLRQKVADLYNHLYRRGKKSQYTYENVSIAGGGRVALTRAVAALGNINMGHIVPDYTAYAELLAMQKTITPIPILLYPEDHYQISVEELKSQIIGLGLKSLLLSNPCNPTGQLIAGESLSQIVKLSRDYQCTCIFDEFYSHYYYASQQVNEMPVTISAAEFIEDVDLDPLILLNGVTKNWRYPGWRISWTVGPKEIIRSIASAGSFLDCGANSPLQYAAMELLEIESVMLEARAIQTHFHNKRDYMLKRLKKMGIIVEVDPQGTFYVWANLSNLPAPLNNAMSFFERGLTKKVITVPGDFFDINPGGRRNVYRFKNHCRISFGPEMHIIEQGLDALDEMISNASVRIHTP